jgi:hypothetical protein
MQGREPCQVIPKSVVSTRRAACSWVRRRAVPIWRADLAAELEDALALLNALNRLDFKDGPEHQNLSLPDETLGPKGAPAEADAAIKKSSTAEVGSPS